jgi:carbonic anhydrase/acetyltransferase-like protein (isoleucine patch superfamily)
MHPRDKRPPTSPTRIHPTVFVAETATIVGEVTIYQDASIWFGAVIRGDADRIVIGEGTNVQDGAVIHCDANFPTTIGKRVVIGHRAVVHGATIADNVMIGIGAIVLNGARVGEYSIIAAGAIVTEGADIPPRSLVMGVPGKVVREVTDEEIKRITDGAQIYIDRAKNYWRGIYK